MQGCKKYLTTNIVRLTDHCDERKHLKNTIHTIKNNRISTKTTHLTKVTFTIYPKIINTNKINNIKTRTFVIKRTEVSISISNNNY